MCRTPGFVDWNATTSGESEARASISARHAISLPFFAPRSIPTTPCPPIPVFTSRPKDVRYSPIFAAVRFSFPPSSGWRCRSLLRATSLSKISSVLDSTAVGLLGTSISIFPFWAKLFNPQNCITHSSMKI